MKLLANNTMANSFTGETLKILALKEVGNFLVVKKNESGAIVETSGILSLIINWISQKYLLNYVIYKDIVSRMADLNGERGILSYILSGEADLVLGAIFPDIKINDRLDFTTSWLDSPLGILIPIPEASTNYTALLQPFRYQVWVLLAVTSVCAIIALYAVSKLYAYLFATSGISLPKIDFDRFLSAYEYASNVIFSQGGWCQARVLSIRLIAAVWCLGCFVLIQSYSSTLFSHVLSPSIHPVINSINDFPNVPDLLVTVDRGRSIETAILTADTGVLKYLGDILRKKPDLRCNRTEECLAKVRSGGHVYINGESVVASLVSRDRKTTGECHFSIAKKTFWPSPIVFGVPKRSKYRDTIDLGLINLRENGLLNYWTDQFLAKRDECVNKYKEKPRNFGIRIINLLGAFIVLFFGCTISLIAFLTERGIFILQKKRSVTKGPKPVGENKVASTGD